MEVLFEIFQLKEPEWTDDFQVALLSVGKINKRKLNKFTVQYQVTEDSCAMGDTPKKS